MEWRVSCAELCNVAEFAKPAINRIDRPMKAANAIEITLVSAFAAVCVAVVIFSSPYRLPRRCLLTRLQGRSPGLWFSAKHRLPGFNQWHMMPANHIQSRGRLRLWAPIWVVPQRIPVSSPIASANIWGTMHNQLSGNTPRESSYIGSARLFKTAFDWPIPLEKNRIVVN